MKKIKQILPILIAFIIGISTTVGAITIFNSKDITYSSDKTDKTNVKDALDELYLKSAKVGACPEGYTCFSPISTVEVGDYIAYQPRGDAFTISKSLTGYTIDQTIKPSNYYLWLVFKKNDDGTVEAVSVSGGVGDTWIAFKGITGYKNFASVLRQASLNIDSGSGVFYPYGSRPMGYKKQLLVCTAIATNTACPTDYDYIDDQQLFYHIVGTSKENEDLYESWLTSRKWTDSKNLGLVYMTNSGIVSTKEILVNGVAKEVAARFRPIVTFNSTVLVESRNGSRDKPLRVLNDSYTGN